VLPAVSTSRGKTFGSPTLTMHDVQKIVADQESRLSSLIRDLSDKIDRVHGKATFPSCDAADKTATPAASAEIEPPQIQPRYGMPMNSYPGQPTPPKSVAEPTKLYPAHVLLPPLAHKAPERD